MAKKKPQWERDMEVEFKGVGIGKEKARIGFSFANGDETENAIRDMFVGSQLSCQLVCDPNDKKDADGQQTMEAAELTLEATAESNHVGMVIDGYSGSLQFSKSGVDLATLGKFSGVKKGKLRCTKIGASDAMSRGEKSNEEENGGGDEVE